MYSPREDSYFLLENLGKYIKKGMKFLEIGAGSGIISQEAKRLGAEVLCTDIDDEAIKQLKIKKLNAIKSDLFNNIDSRFDLIVFNPPYLPADKYDSKKDTTGGKKGYETALKFLRQAEKHLNKNGKILLLLSNLSSLDEFNNKIKKLNIIIKTIAEKPLFFEKLFLFEVTFKG